VGSVAAQPRRRPLEDAFLKKLCGELEYVLSERGNSASGCDGVFDGDGLPLTADGAAATWSMQRLDVTAYCASIEVELSGVPHTFCGGQQDTPEAASKDVAYRVLWYLQRPGFEDAFEPGVVTTEAKPAGIPQPTVLWPKEDAIARATEAPNQRAEMLRRMHTETRRKHKALYANSTPSLTKPVDTWVDSPWLDEHASTTVAPGQMVWSRSAQPEVGMGKERKVCQHPMTLNAACGG
jgi:hypothetical protein